jgi:hypothetical protein
MPELWFGPAADRALDELAADGSRRRLFERVNALLDDLEHDAIVIQYIGPSAF